MGQCIIPFHPLRLKNLNNCNEHNKAETLGLLKSNIMKDKQNLEVNTQFNDIS
jgi:hypothetical protein